MSQKPTRDRPFFSVVVPLYNKAATVERAVRSALAQDFQDLELIVVDDGSTDAGPSIVAQLRDARLRMLRQANSGVSAARNRGVQNARAEYVAFLDADDQWQPGFLSTVRRLVEHYPQAGLYATACQVVDPTRTFVMSHRTAGGDDQQQGPIENYFRAAWSGNSPVISSSVCVRKSALVAVGGFPVGIRSGEDTAVWARLALANQVVASGRCEATYFRVGTEENAQHRYFGRDAHFDHASLLEGQTAYPYYDDLEKWVAAKMYEFAMTALIHGDDRDAVRDVLRSVDSRHWRIRRGLVRTLMLVPDRVRRLLFRLKMQYRVRRNPDCVRPPSQHVGHAPHDDTGDASGATRRRPTAKPTRR